MDEGEFCERDLEIFDNLTTAINILFDQDEWLLTNDLNERSITHKLAEYIQQLYPDYNVDCEYNGNIKRGHGRKVIAILKDQLINAGFLKEREIDNNDEVLERFVYPDIIVHKRGTNTDNYLIIEVKKSTNKIPSTFDDLKLKAYTGNQYGNDLKYEYGFFINFTTGVAKPQYQMDHYFDGDYKGSV